MFCNAKLTEIFLFFMELLTVGVLIDECLSRNDLPFSQACLIEHSENKIIAHSGLFESKVELGVLQSIFL